MLFIHFNFTAFQVLQKRQKQNDSLSFSLQLVPKQYTLRTKMKNNYTPVHFFILR